jgi:hypothetical protein
MNWLIEIFQSTSDQARLVTTLFVAAIALVVVFINQIFNSRRARKEKLISKIEEIYSLIITIQELNDSIHNKITGLKKFDQEESESYQMMHVEMGSSGSKATMLAGLYFNNLSENIGNLRTEYGYLHNAYINAESLEDYLEETENHRSSMVNLFLQIYTDLVIIMNKSMH